MLEQARSAQQAAEKALADLTTPPTALQVAQADLAIATARLQLQQAQDALDKLLRPDIPALEAAVAAAQSALAKAQADVLARQQDTAGKDQLARLRIAEATPTALYNRLAAETYSDAYYQDRLELAFNRMMDAHDPRHQRTASPDRRAASANGPAQERKDADGCSGGVGGGASGRGRIGGVGAGGGAGQAGAPGSAGGAAGGARGAAEAGCGCGRDGGGDGASRAGEAAAGGGEATADLAGATLAAPFAGTVLQTRAGVGDQTHGEQRGGEPGGPEGAAGGGGGGRDDDPADRGGAGGADQLRCVSRASVSGVRCRRSRCRGCCRAG